MDRGPETGATCRLILVQSRGHCSLRRKRLPSLDLVPGVEKRVFRESSAEPEHLSGGVPAPHETFAPSENPPTLHAPLIR